MEYTTVVDPKRVARDLVELMRLETDIAYSKCRSSVISLVAMLKDDMKIAQLQPVFDLLNQDVLDVAECVDAQRLGKCLSVISSFKEDSQQRSWSLYEDEHAIIDRFNELSSLVKLSDRRVPLFVFADNDYRSLSDLVEFYQMETRLTVKLALVNALLGICRLDQKFVDILLQTGLAVYVVGDVAAQETELGSKCIELLSFLFCTGRAPPVGHYDALNDDFIQHILEATENPMTSDNFSVLCMNLLLSFNLHFVDPDDSPVIKQLLQSTTTSAFIQQFLLLANREEDPVWPFAGEPPYVSSVLKLLHDMLATKQLGDRLFYSNDASVLVNILLRELADCSPGMRRLKVVQVVREMTFNTGLASGKLADFIEILSLIRTSEDSLEEEKTLSAEIIDKIR